MCYDDYYETWDFLTDDADFCGSESESDDEMTIEREEAAMQEQGRDDVQEEVSALNKEADQDIDDLLASVRCLEAASLISFLTRRLSQR